MKPGFPALILSALLGGCATDGLPPPVSAEEAEIAEGRPGIFGDLRWNVDLQGRYQPARVSEEEAFKRWKALESNPERREFEEWRAWQEWKRKNPR